MRTQSNPILIACLVGGGSLLVIGCKRTNAGAPTTGVVITRTPKDLVNDFDGLCNWCEQSVNEIQKETRANPIRGKELAIDKDALIRELVGKTVHWRVKVLEIDPAGNVQLESQGQHGTLSVRLQKPRNIDEPYPLRYTIKNVPMPKLHELSVGEFVPVTGTVTLASYEPVIGTVVRPNYGDFFFVIDLDGAKIE
jgi:hypothetical protein